MNLLLAELIETYKNKIEAFTGVNVTLPFTMQYSA